MVISPPPVCPTRWLETLQTRPGPAPLQCKQTELTASYARECGLVANRLGVGI